MKPLQAQLVIPGSEHEDRTCIYCHEVILSGEQVVTCPLDRTVVHLECWTHNLNRCPSSGCAGRGEPIAASTTEPSTTTRPSRLRGSLTRDANASDGQPPDRSSRLRGTLLPREPKS